MDYSQFFRSFGNDRNRSRKVDEARSWQSRCRPSKIGFYRRVGYGVNYSIYNSVLGDRLKSGELKDIIGIPTSFQSEVLAKQYGVPLATLDSIDHIDIAIDGADEVDPQKNLIKGGGAAHTREKVVDYLAEQFIVVVDSGKLVDRLGSSFAVPVEVIPMAITPVTNAIKNSVGNQNSAWV